MPTSSSLLSMSSCPLAECCNKRLQNVVIKDYRGYCTFGTWSVLGDWEKCWLIVDAIATKHPHCSMLTYNLKKNILCWNENILLTSWRPWGRERRWRSWCPPSVLPATWTSGSKWPSCSRRTARRWSRKSDLDGTIDRIIHLSWADSKWASDVTSLTKHSQKKHLPQMWTIWSCALLPPKCAQTALKCAKYA